MNDKKGNRVRRILETKRQAPEYQRLDIEPKEGGKSLLHDEFGILKVSPLPPNKGDIPIMNEISNEPVQIKASVQSSNMKTPILKKGIPSPNNEDDGFVPPRSNFVSVGQKEHTWYSHEVAGYPKETIDNNDEIDVDSLQGIDPLADVDDENISEIRKNFENILSMIEKDALSAVWAVTTLKELDEVKHTIFGKDSGLTLLLKEFKSIPQKEKHIVGDLINYVVENIKLEISAKRDSFEVDGPNYEIDNEEELQDSEEESESDESESVEFPTLQEGSFAILVDDKLFNTTQSIVAAKDILSRLILGNNIDVSRIQVLKRIPVDFGIIFGD